MKIVTFKCFMLAIIVLLSVLSASSAKSQRKKISFQYYWNIVVGQIKETVVNKLTAALIPSNFVKDFKEIVNNSDNKDKIEEELKKLNENLCNKDDKHTIFEILKSKITALPDKEIKITEISNVLSQMTDSDSNKLDHLLDKIKNCDNLNKIVSSDSNILDKILEYSALAIDKVLNLFGKESKKFVVLISLLVIFALIYMVLGIVMHLAQLIISFALTIYIFVKLRSKINTSEPKRLLRMRRYK